jgi:hypothetical protein
VRDGLRVIPLIWLCSWSGVDLLELGGLAAVRSHPLPCLFVGLGWSTTCSGCLLAYLCIIARACHKR